MAGATAAGSFIEWHDVDVFGVASALVCGRLFHRCDDVCCDSPFSVVTDSPERILPGHDPQTMTRYPAAGPDVADIAARIA